jgi:predicted RNase H-like HicB family nuclease
MATYKDIEYLPVEFRTISTRYTDNYPPTYAFGNQNWFFVWINSPIPEHKERGLGYLAILESDEDGGFTATIPTLKGCISEGDTFDDAKKHLNDALLGWIQVAQDMGLQIPEPDGPINV